jgi:hypothetical protein
MPYSSRAKFIHKRKRNPKQFDPRSFRVKTSKKGCVKVTLGCPKGHYHPKKKGKRKCDVKLKVQKVMLKKTCYPGKRGD